MTGIKKIGNFIQSNTAALGIIEKQTIRGSFFSYVGVAFGFVTVGLLWPHYLEPEEIGLINFLVAISAILAHVGGLGINSVCIRLFPYFRDPMKRHNGFLGLSLIFIFGGTLLITGYYFLFRQNMIDNNVGKSTLIVRYVWLIVPFTVATILYNLFDSLHKVIYDAVIGVFVKEFVFRLLNFVLIILYAAFAIRFQLFLNLYFLIFSIPALVLIIMLSTSHQFSLSFNFSFIGRDLWKSIAGVSFFGLLGGMGTLAVSNIDKIMINRLIDLEATGIYSIAFLFGTIITLPSRSLSKIATIIIAESWKKDDLATIQDIYTKSSLTQFIFGGLIFLLVWLNVDLVFQVIPAEYAAGKYVILYMSLAGVVEMATGLNGMIISTSRYYHYQSVFIFILLGLVVGTNLVFIPKYGITGAAIASLISTVIYNLVRAGFLFLKFRMQPFNLRFLVVLGALLLTFLVGYLFRDISSWVIRTTLVCLSILLLYVIPLWVLGISADINHSVNRIFRQVMDRFRGNRK